MGVPESAADTDPDGPGGGLGAVFDVVRRLRAPDGCPWDREQTHLSLRPYLLEETYELLEAIDSGDDEKLREELGDVLLQVAMHAEIAAEAGRFDAVAVSEGVAAKMVKRHPHVFGDVEVADAEEVLRNWERGKAAEATQETGQRRSVIDRVPPAMPALAWCLGLQKRAARVGFDYQAPAAGAEPVVAAARQLLEENDGDGAAGADHTHEALGDLLFALVNLARKRRLNPEDALRASGQRFRRRYLALEAKLAARGVQPHDLEDAEIQALWSSLEE